MRIKIFFCFPALILMMFCAISANAQVPQLINYQGQLNDVDGGPRNGTFDFEFRIYGAQTGGSSLWSEKQNNITTDPNFSVLLGSVTAFPSNLFASGTSRFLEVRVEGITLSPREQFASVPYAFTSGSGGGGSVWSTNNNDIFYNNGDVGIGITNPQARLEVRNGGIRSSSSSRYVELRTNEIYFSRNSASRLHAITAGGYLTFVTNGRGDSDRESNLVLKTNLDSYFNGSVGINTTNPNYDLEVIGSIGSGSMSYHSDIRWKKNVSQLQDALEKVVGMRGVTYEWRVDEFNEMNFTAGKQIGVIAQEIEEVVPEIVSSDQQGFKSVDYAKLTALLIEAVKELKDENKAMRNRIESLEKRMIANKGLVSNSSAKID